MIYKKLSELKKLTNNPRFCKWEKFEKLINSIKKFWIIEWRPFLISNRTWENIIIWWNQRFEACKKLWIDEVPCFIFENLTEEEEKEIIIRDNISNWDWDYEILSSDFKLWDIEEWWVNLDFLWDDIDFDNIKNNEDRENTKKVQNIICPKCEHSFTI